MNEMPEFAKRDVLSCLRDLANRELQRRSWLQGEPGGPVSPEELVSELFDDTALADYLGERRERPIFSSRIDALLVRISNLLDEIDLNIPPRALLQAPAWLEIQTKAAEVADLIEEHLVV